MSLFIRYSIYQTFDTIYIKRYMKFKRFIKAFTIRIHNAKLYLKLSLLKKLLLKRSVLILGN